MLFVSINESNPKKIDFTFTLNWIVDVYIIALTAAAG